MPSAGDLGKTKKPQSTSETKAAASKANNDRTFPHPAAPWLQVPVETRKAHPMHILCQDNVWYVYLWDPMRKAKRRFTLSRIRSVSRSGKPFKPRRLAFMSSRETQVAQFDAWFDRIDDPWQRARAAVRSYWVRRGDDPDGARQWLSSLENVDPGVIKLTLMERR